METIIKHPSCPLSSYTQTELYQKMYAILCAAASDAMDALLSKPETLYARWILERALHTAEELYLCYAEQKEM